MTAARRVCRRWNKASSVDDMLDGLKWPSLEDRRLKSSLTFFNKIHPGTLSLDKDGRSSLTNEKDHNYFLNRFVRVGEFFDG